MSLEDLSAFPCGPVERDTPSRSAFSCGPAERDTPPRSALSCSQQTTERRGGVSLEGLSAFPGGPAERDTPPRSASLLPNKPPSGGVWCPSKAFPPSQAVQPRGAPYPGALLFSPTNHQAEGCGAPRRPFRLPRRSSREGHHTPERYDISLIIEINGTNIAITMVPMINANITIIIGSMIEVMPSTAVSTSSS